MPLSLTNFELSTTDNNSSVFNTSPENPYLQKVGAGTDEVTIDSLGKYNIDIFGDVKSFSPKDFPMLTIAANVGGVKMPAPVMTWIDEYEGDLWADIKLDDIRESTRLKDASGAPTLYGGRLAWRSVTTYPTDLADAAFSENPVSELALASGNILRLGFNTGSDYIRGKKQEVIRKIVNLCEAMKYTRSALDGNGGDDQYIQYAYSAGTSKRIYLCFDDLGIKCGSTYYEKHEIIAGIDKLCFNVDYSEFIIDLDFDDSNFDDLDATATNNVVLLEEVSLTDGTAFDASHKNYYTRMSRLAMIGNIVDVPAPVAEGSNFTRGTNFVYGQDQYLTYAQIFESDKYGITGTRQATQVRFKDEWLNTRRRKLMLYKQGITAAMLWGKLGMDFDTTTGYPKRSMPGIFDYEAFPIRYMRNELPDVAAAGSGVVVGHQLKAWCEDIAYSLNAYKQQGSESHTLLCSRQILDKLSDWASYIGSVSGNIFGSTFVTTPPSQATLGLEITEFRSRYGTLRFIHEPALDYMPRFPKGDNTKGGIPQHLFSNGLNPRQTLIALDKAFYEFMTFRPDQILGSIQDPGADIFEEGMRGEHSSRLRFPRNHAIIFAG